MFGWQKNLYLEHLCRERSNPLLVLLTQLLLLPILHNVIFEWHPASSCTCVWGRRRRRRRQRTWKRCARVSDRGESVWLHFDLIDALSAGGGWLYLWITKINTRVRRLIGKWRRSESPLIVIKWMASVVKVIFPCIQMKCSRRTLILLGHIENILPCSALAAMMVSWGRDRRTNAFCCWCR